MKKLILLLALIGWAKTMSAQMTATDSVKATINQFFEGMKNVDTALIRSTVTEGVIFQTILNKKDGTTVVRTESVSDFLVVISKQKKGELDERITFGSVQVDGSLASVWTPYRFYVDSKFYHCGANSFQLVKLKDKWQIQYLVDTRRRMGCDE